MSDEAREMVKKKLGIKFYGPRSICVCGHTGDGEKSQHADEYFSFGSGECLVNGCSCTRFTWKQFIILKNL